LLVLLRKEKQDWSPKAKDLVESQQDPSNTELWTESQLVCMMKDESDGG
jgi:hypothetical protein